MRRNRGFRSLILAWAAGLAAPSAAADETAIELAAGPGRDEARAACAMCHSLDYIVMNSPFLDKAGWEKTVDKMIVVMGAPLTPEESALIVDYLARHYGP